MVDIPGKDYHKKRVNHNYNARKIEDVGRLPHRVVTGFEFFILIVSPTPPEYLGYNLIHYNLIKTEKNYEQTCQF